MTVLTAALLALLCAAAQAKERVCPSGYVAYETHQPGSPYMCVKPQARKLPEPDMACPSRKEREREKKRLREAVDRADCEPALAKRRLKPLDCYDLQSIRDLKSAALARVQGDDDEAEALARAVCPLTAPLACMNPEPQCRTRLSPPVFTPWRRPWEDEDVADVAKYYQKRLPVDAKQAAALAARYKRKHPAYWTVDDVDE